MNDPSKIEVLLAAWKLRYRQSKPISIEELCSDCPELIPELKRRIQTISTKEFPDRGGESVTRINDPDSAAPNDEATVNVGQLPPRVAPSKRPQQEFLWKDATAKAGDYLLQEEIARGGMGVIYRASDPKFDRALAVKVVSSRVAHHPETQRRFLAEARITGKLQHPGIAPVHEVGELEDGRPFFAMKLIEGSTLAKLLQGRKKPADDLPKFLNIFEYICQTLSYAHSLGVIHRDLKPANIMVGAFGEVQVMDWGLAKNLAEETDLLAETGISAAPIDTSAPGTDWQTSAGAVLGTPAYMAPEQARGEIAELDARCDVFGLGAILCEILTGSPPYTGSDKSQLLRNASSGDLADVFDRLSKCGADDLVDLAKRCLAPRKEDRPATAGEVSDAIQKHQSEMQDRLRQAELERAAVEAKSAEERRRRRITVLLAAAILLIVVGVSGGTFWYLRDQANRRSETELRQAALKRDIAQSVEKAQAMRKELYADLQKRGGLLRLLDRPEHWRSRIIASQSFLEQAKRLLSRAGVPIATKWRQSIRDLDSKLRQDEQNRLFAIKLEEIRLDSAKATDLSEQRKLAKRYPEALEKGGWEIVTGKEKELASRIRNSALREILLAALIEWSWFSGNKLGLNIAGIVAEQPIREFVHGISAGDKKRANAVANGFGPQDWNLVSTLLLVESKSLEKGKAFSIAILRRGQIQFPSDFTLNSKLGFELFEKKPDEALQFFRAALAVRPKSPQLYAGMAEAYRNLKQHAQAADAFARAIMLDRNSAELHYNLANTCADMKDPVKAIVFYKKAIELDPKLKGPHINMGRVLAEMGKKDEALRALRKAFELQPNSARVQSQIGQALAKCGDLAGAVQAYDKAMKLAPKDKEIHHDFAYTLYTFGKYELAIKAYRKALELEPNNTTTLVHLGVALDEAKQPQDAIEAFRRAIKINPNTKLAYINLGATFLRMGEWQDAVAAFRKGLAIDPNYPASHMDMATALSKLGRYQEAEMAYLQAIRMKPDLGVAYLNYANDLHNHGRAAEALSVIDKGMKYLPPKHRFHRQAKRLLALCKKDFAYEKMLPQVLAAKLRNIDDADLIGLAKFCQYRKKHFPAAVKLYVAILKKRPNLATAIPPNFPYDATCVSLLAAAEGKAAKTMDAKQQRELRLKAFQYLKGNLELWKGQMKNADSEFLKAMQKKFRHWLRDTDLSTVREPAALAQLPDDEYNSWRQLWCEVEVLVRTALITNSRK